MQELARSLPVRPQSMCGVVLFYTGPGLDINVFLELLVKNSVDERRRRGACASEKPNGVTRVRESMSSHQKRRP